jgi:hypothetical protein
MNSINEFSNEVLRIAEAVALRDALNLYIQKIQAEYDHNNENYGNAMAFLKMLYTKYYTISQTQVELDIYGNYTVKKQQDRRKDLNLN